MIIQDSRETTEFTFVYMILQDLEEKILKIGPIQIYEDA